MKDQNITKKYQEKELNLVCKTDKPKQEIILNFAARQVKYEKKLIIFFGLQNETE